MKRCINVTLFMVFIAMSIAFQAYADPLEGNGTAENPYKIYDAEDFLSAAEMVSNDNELYGKSVYSIQCCIDFSGTEFTPLGTSASPFGGTLLGNGHIMKNISVGNVPEFGIVGYMNSGKLCDVNVDYGNVECTVSEMLGFGGIVGFAEASSSEKIVVSGCSSEGNLTINIGSAIYAGGIAGKLNEKKGNVAVENCISDMSITLKSKNGGFVGGVVGHLKAETGVSFEMKNCVSTGSVTLDSDIALGYVGGFVGFVTKEPDNWSGWISGKLLSENGFDGCFAAGNVKSPEYGGGFAGIVGGEATISTGAVISGQTVVANVIENSPKAYDAERLREESFFSSELGYDLVNVWKLDGENKLVLQSKCVSCPKILLDGDKLEVYGLENGYVVVVAGFKNSVMNGIKLKTAEKSYFFSELGDLSINSENTDFVKVFVFKSVASLKPLTMVRTAIISK